MSPSIKQLRQQIAEQAQYRCGYCLTLEVVSGIPLTLEHIIPGSQGGQNEEDNLSLNSELRIRARTIWVEAGWHPPR